MFLAMTKLDTITHSQKETYYQDLYDLHTIEECLRSIEYWRDASKKVSNSEELKDLSEQEKAKHFAAALNMDLYQKKGYRYEHRASTIQEWIRRDQGNDEKVVNTQIPQNTGCSQCSCDMNVIFRDIYLDSSRVLFFFECPSCKKRKGIFDNGEPYVSRPELCPKCKKELKVLYSKKGRILEWKKSCKTCGFKETEIDDWDKNEAERQKKSAQEKELLKRYRSRFCMSEKEGQDYIECSNRLKMLTEFLQKTEQKRTDPDYQKVTSLKKITIVELEKQIFEIVEKEKYIKLILEKPEIDRHVIVPFTVQDADSSRKENASVCKLNRIIKKTLEGTNWRLMSEGVHYRLGYLSGRLKGYEQEEDLLQLVKKDKKQSALARV